MYVADENSASPSLSQRDNYLQERNVGFRLRRRENK
jgi:hypothetical protein